jgi:hypothetical protein
MNVNAATVIAELLPALNTVAIADLTFWTKTELYGYADEAVKRLARSVGLFVERDAATAIIPGTATYSLPTRHISTVHVSLGGRALQPAAIQDLEALDDVWPATEDEEPTHYVQDGAGCEQLTLYPKLAVGASGNIAVIHRQYLATVTEASPAFSAPEAVREYLTFRMLESARSKESKAAMPEVAAWAGQMAGLCEQAAQAYWGEAL